jgi:signal peptidase II
MLGRSRRAEAAAGRSGPAIPRTVAWARLGAVIAAVVAIDQITKAIAVAALARGESVNVFYGIDLTHVRNTGVAFGALSGGGILVLALVGVAVALLLGYFALQARRPWMWLPAGAILGGALGNVVDRVREGNVIDFIDPVLWPAFNLADTCVVLGVLGLLYVADGGDEEERGSAEPPADEGERSRPEEAAGAAR